MSAERLSQDDEPPRASEQRHRIAIERHAQLGALRHRESLEEIPAEPRQLGRDAPP